MPTQFPVFYPVRPQIEETRRTTVGYGVLPSPNGHRHQHILQLIVHPLQDIIPGYAEDLRHGYRWAYSRSMKMADGRTTLARLLLIFMLSGCTALPLDPVSNHHLLSVGQVGFEKDKESCRQEAIDEGHDTKLKLMDMLLPFLLALGGAGLGLEAEYGSALHPNEHPYYGGKVLFGLAIGGFVVGSALSIVGVLSRKRAQEAFIHDCLRGRGYEFSE